MEKIYEKYNKIIRPALQKELGKKNVFEIPAINKVVVSAGIGEFKDDDAAVKKVSGVLARIVGLTPKITHSRKAVSSFKLRIGQPVGLTSTLRGELMYDFIDRFINIALPRVRDFRGLSLKAFDGRGNYCVGVKDCSMFPEFMHDEAIKNFGFQINFQTSAKNNEDALALFKALGFPFEKKDK